jgi:putative FmdB family regulatory protein
MPIYEYQCGACGHRLEAMQKMADAPLTDCPACNSQSLSKLISAVGFRLGGSGWYETDFKSGGKRNLAEKESGKAGESKAGDSKAGDSKRSDSKSEKAAAPTPAGGTSKGSCTSCA